MPSNSRSKLIPALLCLATLGGAWAVQAGCSRKTRAAAPDLAASAGAADAVDVLRRQIGLDQVLPLEQALQSHPGDELSHRRLAEAYSRTGDPVGAALALYPLTRSGVPGEGTVRFITEAALAGWWEEVAAAVESLPDPPVRSRLDLAGTYVGHGQADGAVEQLRLSERRKPQPDEWLEGASLWLQVRRPHEAVRWARSGLAGKSADPAARLLLVRCLLAAGQPEAALKELPATGGEIGDAVVEFWRGRAELASKSPPLRLAGIQRLARIAGEDPENGPAAFAAGSALLAAGNHRAAVPLLGRAAETGHQEVLAYERLAEAYAGLGQAAEGHWARGRALALRGLHAEAEAELRQAVKQEPSRDQFYLDLARTVLAEGRAAPALRELERAPGTRRGNAEAAFLRAELLGRLERVSDQVAALQKVLDEHPGQAGRAWTELGRVYAISLQDDRAEEALGRALVLAPDEAATHEQLGIVLARRSDDPARARRAIEHLTRAVALNPGSFAAWSKLASVLQETENVPETAACYRRAILADPRWESIYLSLGLILRSQNRSAELALMQKLYREARVDTPRRMEVERSAEFKRRDPEARFALGDYLLRHRLPRPAYVELLAAASLRPGWKEAQLRLADACALLDYPDLQRLAEEAAEK